MTANVSAEPASNADRPVSVPRLRTEMSVAHGRSVVGVTGELDLATRNQLVAASTAGHQPQTVLDLGGVTFMDCSGYSSLAASRRIIEGQGRSLKIRGQTGQPARLFALIAELENRPVRPQL